MELYELVSDISKEANKIIKEMSDLICKKDDKKKIRIKSDEFFHCFKEVIAKEEISPNLEIEYRTDTEYKICRLGVYVKGITIGLRIHLATITLENCDWSYPDIQGKTKIQERAFELLKILDLMRK